MITAGLAALTVTLAVLGLLAGHRKPRGTAGLLLLGGSVILLVLQIGIFAGQVACWIAASSLFEPITTRQDASASATGETR